MARAGRLTGAAILGGVRRVACLLAGALACLGVTVAPSAAAGAQPAPARPVLQVQQDLRDLVVHVDRVRRRQRVCLEIAGSPRAACVEPGRRVMTLREDGRFIRRLPAAVHRDLRRVAVTFRWSALSLRPGRVTLRAVRDDCTRAGRCDDASASLSTAETVRLRAVVVTGCRAKAPYELRGVASSHLAALTFDDGPSGYTKAVLDVLRREHVHATFFVLGKEIGGREAVLRRMLADGNEIGDHSWNHADLAAGGLAAQQELQHTREAVRHATGYTPCTMRPPYGATSGALVGLARSLNLVSVLWNVDPQDWSDPGTGAIVARVDILRPGGIAIMHDGGGPRGQTVAALPTIIHTLRGRGLRLVTVRELLGLRPVLGYRA